MSCALAWWLFFSLASPISSVRLSAVRRLSDQAAIARVALGDEDRGVQSAAVERLTDQVSLAKLATRNEYSFARASAVKNLTDQATLACIAAHGNEWEWRGVRRSAFEKLTGQTTLTQIAIAADDSEIRKAAVEKLSDPVSLARVATNAENPLYVEEQVVNNPMQRAYFEGRVSAIERLNPEELSLAAMKTDERQERTYLLAVAKFLLAGKGIPAESRSHLLAMFLPLAVRYSDPLWVSRFGELKDISLHRTLTEGHYTGGVVGGAESIAFAAEFVDKESSRRLSASWIAHLPDHVWPPEIFFFAPIKITDVYIPWLATDQEALAQVATSDSIVDFRAAAVSKLNDQAILAKIATSDTNSEVRAEAAERLRKLQR